MTLGSLQNKVVVITGASGLLGKQHALAVLEEGGSVALLDLSLEVLERRYREASQIYGDKILFLECDICDEKQVVAAMGAIESKLGVATGLVNNAAINPSVEKNTHTFSRVEDLTFEDWNLQLNVGLYGSFVCSKIFGKRMVDLGLSGSLVHISSDHGIIAPNQNLYAVEGLPRESQPVKPVTYSVVKHGLIGLSRYFATYWARDNVRSNALCPGGVANGQPEEFIDRFNQLVPLGRLARPDEYKGALVYLLSDNSSYMTGSTMVVDGGRSAW